jgi:hypothetical protein
MYIQTNADNPLVAKTLSDARNGTLSSLIYRQKGVVRGGKVCGDDLVHTVFVCGFIYENAVKKSAKKLFYEINMQDIVDEAAAKNILDKDGNAITLADACAARDELLDSFDRTLNPNEPSTSTTADVYEPLVVDGEAILGARVYTGPDDPSNKRAPKPGTIYLQGLKIGKKILEAGAPRPKTASKAKTIAKSLIRRHLAVGSYVSFALERGTDYILRVGGQAALAAKDDNVEIKDMNITEVFDIAV